MYLRFVVADIDEDSEKELGVFHAVRYLREDGKLYHYEEDRHDLIRGSFNENLEKPTRFTASKPLFIEGRTKPSLGSRTAHTSTLPTSGPWWQFCKITESQFAC